MTIKLDDEAFKKRFFYCATVVVDTEGKRYESSIPVSATEPRFDVPAPRNFFIEKLCDALMVVRIALSKVYWARQNKLAAARHTEHLRTLKEFNELEKAVFQWFIDTYKDENLSRQIKAAKLTERAHTGKGFYITVEIPKDIPKVDIEWPLTGPSIESKDIEYGGGSLLWGKDGFVDFLEMYAYGDTFEKNVKEFNLTDILI